MHPEAPRQSLEVYFANEGLLEDIVQQLQKDLGTMIDLGPDFKTLAFEDMLIRMGDILADLDKKDTLRATLYRIDVKEGPWNDYAHLAQKVLDRELQKVWYRKWYRHFKS